MINGQHICEFCGIELHGPFSFCDSHQSFLKLEMMGRIGEETLTNNREQLVYFLAECILRGYLPSINMLHERLKGITLLKWGVAYENAIEWIVHSTGREVYERVVATRLGLN